MRPLSSLLSIIAGAALVSTWACTPAADEEGSSQDQIKGAGTSGATYPEAVLIDAQNQGDGKSTWKCSGAVIAPKVVLTSGICAGSHTQWTIKAPQANRQTVTSTTALAYKWAKNAKGNTDIKAHNIGLIFLDKAIVLPSYPVLARKPVSPSQKAIVIGRTRDSQVSNTELFSSEQLTLRTTSGGPFPFDYTSGRIVELGDSGGPQELVGSVPHMIVSVTSKIVGDKDTFSRVDQLDVADWIQQQVETHGGFADGTDAGVDSGETPDAGATDASADASNATSDAGDAAADGAIVPVELPFGGPCTVDADCNAGRNFSNFVCSTGGSTCIKGCHSNLDCPGSTVCDMNLPTWDCR